MSAKRIRNAVLLILIPVAGYFIFQLYRISRPSSLPSMVPGNAGSVLFIHTLKLSAHLDDLKHIFAGDTPGSGRWASAIQSFRKGGTDMIQGIAVFTLHRSTYGMLVLRDRSAWNRHIEENTGRFADLRTVNRVSACQDMQSGFSYAWNDHTLLFSISELSLTDAETILGTKPEVSFQKTAAFASYTDTSVAWFRIDTLNAGGLQMKNVSGTLQIRNRSFFVHAAEASAFCTENPTLLQTSDSLTVIYTDRGMEIPNMRMREMSLILLGAADKRVEKLDYNQTSKTLTIGGLRVQGHTRVTYSYDDEFNLNTDTITTYDTVRAACLHTMNCPDGDCFTVCNMKDERMPDIHLDSGTLLYARIGKPGIPYLLPDETTAGMIVQIRKCRHSQQAYLAIPFQAVPVLIKIAKSRQVH